jgi:hypothetical protein
MEKRPQGMERGRSKFKENNRKENELDNCLPPDCKV